MAFNLANMSDMLFTSNSCGLGRVAIADVADMSDMLFTSLGRVAIADVVRGGRLP